MRFLTFVFSTIICFSFLNCSSSRGHTNSSIIISEEKEFAELMKLDALDKKERAAEAVNLFLNEQTTDTKSALLFNNKSNCNIIIRISGNGNRYNLPVEKNNLNYIVLKKGNYHFQSKLCNSNYQSSKSITGSVEITLSER